MQIRIDEGIRRAVLAREAQVSDKTVQRVESGEGSTPATLNAILIALNALRKTTGRSNYSFQEVFPNH
jgi:transcriptional regulator with XRE-family HTH domain